MNRAASFAILIVLIVVAGVTACQRDKPKVAPIEPPKTPTPVVDRSKPAQLPPPTELVIEEPKVGTGATATAGSQVTVHFVGSIFGGAQFDDSRKRGEPFQFVLGAGQVMQAWDVGVTGMKVGGHRKLIVPPKLGYGEKVVPGNLIPPNSTLVFEIDLVGLNSPAEFAAAQKKLLAKSGGAKRPKNAKAPAP